MSESSIDADMIVRAVLDRHPRTIAVFMRRRMHCPGCVMSGLMTLAEAAESYRIDPGELVAELRDAVSADQAGDRA